VAEVRVPALVGDHMVLERDAPVRVWGWAAAGEEVRVSVAGQSVRATADAEGRWSARLSPRPAGGPHTLVVEGENRLSFDDVWFGEVWLASGQSNMEWPLGRATGGEEAAAAGCDGLRLFTVQKATSLTEKDDVSGSWQQCDAGSAPSFSAVAFYFGQALRERLGVEIGLIHSSWGGTPAEAWTSRGALQAEPALAAFVSDFDAALGDTGAREAFARRLSDWERQNLLQDEGIADAARGWSAPDLEDGAWDEMELPRPWEQASLPIDGAVWFRRTVDIPIEWAGRDLTLGLGAIDDFDVTWFAGEEVGRTGAETPGYWTFPRSYAVPGRLVRSGAAVVAVRVFDHAGEGGFAGAARDMSLAPADGRGAPISLAGPWRYRVERREEPVQPDYGSQPRYPSVDNPNSPTVLYNAMLAPLAPYAIRGAIWYQGESNAGAAWQYRTLFPTMIRDWRRAFGSDFPFYFVQLANFMARRDEPGESAWAELREAQRLTLAEPATGMAVTIDIGEAEDIHPRNKQDVGRRLARWALADTYGLEVEKSGPLFASSSVEGAALRLRFDHAEGLRSRDGRPPIGFAVAGQDRRWRWADARIEGTSVVVSSRQVPHPVAARYAWADNPAATLENGDGLPASPFRTDDWPWTTQR